MTEYVHVLNMCVSFASSQYQFAKLACESLSLLLLLFFVALFSFHRFTKYPELIAGSFGKHVFISRELILFYPKIIIILGEDCVNAGRFSKWWLFYHGDCFF